MTAPGSLGSYVDLNAADKVAAAITQALAAFITYENRRHQRVNLFEAFLYKPLIDVADARGWSVQHEYKIKSKVKDLEGKEIDFVLKKNSNVCSIEVKYFRSTPVAKTSLNNVMLDVSKLSYFDQSRMKGVKAVGGYLIVVAKRAVLSEAFATQPRDLQRRSIYEKARFLLEDGRQDQFYEWGWRSDEIGADIAKNTVLTLRTKNETYAK